MTSLGDGRRLVWGGRWSGEYDGAWDGWVCDDAALHHALTTAPEVVVLDALSFPWEVYLEAGPDVPLVVVLPPELSADEISATLGAPVLRELTPYDRVVEPRREVREHLRKRVGVPETVWLQSAGETMTDLFQAVTDYCNRSVETVTTDIGVFHAHQDDLVTRHLQEHGAHQRGTLEAVLSLVKAGDEIVDVGAHIGTFTVPLARAVAPAGRVVAVEAMPENAALLRRNVADNGLAELVTVVAQPVGSSRGGRYSAVLEAGNSGATRLMRERFAEGRLEESETIDAIVETTGLEPSLIKLDVEGGELAALLGAEATVRRLRPTLVIEVSDAQLLALGDSAIELDRWLEDHGYDAFAITGDRNGRSPVWQLEPVTGSLGQVDDDLFDIVASPKGEAPAEPGAAAGGER